MRSAPAEFLAARHASLARALEREALDGLLVSHPPNIAYLTGFFGSAATLVASRHGLFLFSDTRYAAVLEELGRDVANLDVSVSRPGEAAPDELLAQHVAGLGPARLGFETSSLTVRRHVDLSARLAAAGAKVELVGTDGLLALARAVKDAWEVQILREAGQRLSDVAKCIIPRALAGLAEREVAASIEWELRQKGFERPAFDTIVAAGPNAALPHHRAGERRLAEGDLVVIDFGGVLGGYAVDMTRTVAIGPVSTRQRACLDAVAEAQRAAFEASRVGTRPDEVDGAARRVLERHGMAEAFVHGLGHGIGLEVHEEPRLTRRRDSSRVPPLAAGMVFTLEPGVYFPGWGGVRIEDDVLATDGGPEWLTGTADGM